MTDNPVAWLRAQIQADLDRWLSWIAGFKERWGFSDTGSALSMRDAADRVADCEAKLAILDEHAMQPGPFPPSCRTCVAEDADPDYGPPPALWPCQTVRLLASAFKLRQDYEKHWGSSNAGSH